MLSFLLEEIVKHLGINVKMESANHVPEGWKKQLPCPFSSCKNKS
jgi:hypothetical protein